MMMITDSSNNVSRWLSLLPLVGLFVVLSAIGPSLIAEGKTIIDSTDNSDAATTNGHSHPVDQHPMTRRRVAAVIPQKEDEEEPSDSQQRYNRRLMYSDDEKDIIKLKPGDPFTNKELSKMKESFQIARAKYWTNLKQDYGEYRDDIFEEQINGTTVSVGRTLFANRSAVSWDRMVRKMAMKVLQAQTTGKLQPFVWATGGHSSAAAHGDLSNESYTRTLMRNVPDAFEAVGLAFHGRPYAMGATGSGFEISSCIKEVFGTDVDIFSWDYGMTTGAALDTVEHWMWRAAMLETRPALINLHNKRYLSISEEMAEYGLPSLTFTQDQVDKASGRKFPDTNEQTEEEANKMPKYVRKFRCGRGYEKGGQVCESEKWSLDPDENEPCNKRRYRMGWHPGWKWHAWYGNLFSLFMMETIEDALKLIEESGSDGEVLFKELKAKEDADYKKFSLMANVPNITPGFAENAPDIPLDVIYRKPNICHTARLPSELRYKGILTEVGENDTGVGNMHYLDYSYDRGMTDARELIKGVPPKDLQLVYSPGLYQPQCTKHLIQVDHPDFFVVNSYGPTTVVLPNPTEKAYYGLTEPLQGYIRIVKANCHWGCPGDSVGGKDMYTEDNVMNITVNGVSVVNMTDDFLKHESGHKFEPNKDGLFEITLQTNTDKKYMRLSSIIIW